MDLERARSWRPSPGAIAVVAVATLWVALALGQLNDLLGAMHVAGAPSYTISDLAGGPRKAAEVLRVWTAHAAEAVPVAGSEQPPPDALEIVRLLGRLDSLLLVPLYVLLGVLFFRRAELDPARDVQQLPLLGRVSIGVAAIFDVVENAAQTRVVDGWTSTEKLADRQDAIHTWAQVLHYTAIVKWVASGLAVLCAALIGWGLVADLVHRHRHRAGAAARRAHLTGFHVAAAIVTIVLFNQQGQVADLYRRWQAPQAALSLVALAFAGFALWIVTRRLILRGTSRPCRPGRAVLVKRALFFGVLALAGLQFGAHKLFDDARFDPGWGLLVPAGLLVALAFLGLGMRRDGDGPTPERPVPHEAPEEDAREPILPRLLATGLVIGFALALLRSSFGYAVYTRQWAWWDAVGLATAAACGGAVGVALRRLVPPATGAADSLARRVLREPVTFAVLGTLAGLLVLAPWSGSEDIEPVLLVALSALLVVGALRWYVAMGRELMPGVDVNLGLAGAAFGIVVVVVPLLVAFYAIGVGQALSVPGVAAVALAAAALLGGLVVWSATWIPRPRAFRRLKAFPVTTFLVVWFVVASTFDTVGTFHDARLDTGTPPATGRTAQGHLSCWLVRHGLPRLRDTPLPQDTTCDPGADPPGPVPLILVASTGGGIRSAYWTATALDCAFELETAEVDDDRPCPGEERADGFDRSDALFALSGISGGSVGMAEYAAHLVAKERSTRDGDWVADALEVDALSPAGARWLFVEIPRVFLQFDGPDDRAAVLEAALEHEWPERELERGLFEVARDHPHVPLLLLNSTSVTDGCRFNVSVLDASIESLVPARRGKTRVRAPCRSNAPFDEPTPATRDVLGRDSRVPDTSVLPATRDLTDLLCDAPVDMSLSTASLLSARFPYVNPAGRVGSRCPVTRPGAVHGVDGGYLDTSGASPLVELMTALQPALDEVNAAAQGTGRCVVPFLIQIDNGFDDSAPPRTTRRPTELLAPLTTLFATRLGRAAEARTAAARRFTRPFPAVELDGRPVSNRYAHFVNEAHPGPGAPFGWAQSRFSQRELVGQLAQPRNLVALREVRGWFEAIRTGALTCAG